MESSARYTHDECVHNSEKVAWTVGDILGDGKIDFSRPFLPESLAQVAGISCLDPNQKLKLNQLRGLTYTHLFGFVEEFILRKIYELAGSYGPDHQAERRSLLRFTDEEVKHQVLFDRAKELVLAGLGAECGLVPGAVGVARLVLAKSTLGVMLLTEMVEWTTHHHYSELFRASAQNEQLDPTFVRIFKAHWIEEAQHTKIDGLEVLRIAGEALQVDRDRAVDEVLELGGMLDGLLKAQGELDLASLERLCGRTFRADDRAEILAKQQKAYRFTFLVSGLTHENVIHTIERVSPGGAAKLATAAASLMAA